MKRLIQRLVLSLVFLSFLTSTVFAWDARTHRQIATAALSHPCVASLLAASGLNRNAIINAASFEPFQVVCGGVSRRSSCGVGNVSFCNDQCNSEHLYAADGTDTADTNPYVTGTYYSYYDPLVTNNSLIEDRPLTPEEKLGMILHSTGDNGVPVNHAPACAFFSDPGSASPSELAIEGSNLFRNSFNVSAIPNINNIHNAWIQMRESTRDLAEDYAAVWMDEGWVRDVLRLLYCRSVSDYAKNGIDNSMVWSTVVAYDFLKRVTSGTSSILADRYGHTSVVFDGKMWAIGGRTRSSVPKKDVWSSLDGETWAQICGTIIFPARWGHTSIVFGDKMWVIGGRGDGWPDYYKNDVWYSSDGVNWGIATSRAAFSAREGHTSLVFGNKMWVIGGADDTGIRNDVWYSLDGVNWIQATSAAAFGARYRHTSVVFHDKMWVIGGQGGSGVSSVYYSTDGVNWTQATSAAAFPARNDHTSIVFDNKMWVIGGGGESYPDLCRNDVWYSSDGVAWTQATSAAAFGARDNRSSVVFDGKMWVIGGDTSDEGAMNDVWSSTNGSTWMQTTPVSW